MNWTLLVFLVTDLRSRTCSSESTNIRTEHCSASGSIENVRRLVQASRLARARAASWTWANTDRCSCLQDPTNMWTFTASVLVLSDVRIYHLSHPENVRGCLLTCELNMLVPSDIGRNKWNFCSPVYFNMLKLVGRIVTRLHMNCSVCDTSMKF